MAGPRRRAVPGTAARAGRTGPGSGTRPGGTCRRAPRHRPWGAVPCRLAGWPARTAPWSRHRGSPAARCSFAPPGSGLHGYQVAGGVVQPLATPLGADHDVLDPGAMRARVDAGLDGERHARRQRLGVPGHDVGILVALQADPVAGPVHEVLAVTSRGDRLAGRRVDRLRGHTGPDRDARRLLSVPQHLVIGGELRGRRADRVGPGAVRAVPAG